MAVERVDARVDAQIAGIISSAQQQLNKTVNESEAADVQRREVEKKAQIKKEEIKESLVSRESFQRQNQVQHRMQQIMGGAHGPDAANALNQWQNNQQLQAKLTDAQKNLFREAMAKDPARATPAAQALNRLTDTPGFNKAVTTAPQMATLQAGVMENPRIEKPIADALQSRFMQSPKADPDSKNQFLRFAMQRAREGQMESMKRAGDMLGVLAQHTPKPAQRAAMQMVARRPEDMKAMASLDHFVQQPTIGKLPSFARGKATELLAKANGSAEVKQGFETLAGHGKFTAQSTKNKGRFFATIGSGRPSEYRAITDTMLTALQSNAFPTREAQVSRFLTKVASHVQRNGAGGLDAEGLVKTSRGSSLPRAPQMQSTAGLSEDDAAKVRAQNRAKVIQFFTHLQRTYDGAEKKLASAKYFEDVNNLQTLRKAEDIDVSHLSPEDRAFVDDRSRTVGEKLESLQKLQRQRARELRTKRMPLAKRRAQMEERRAVGRQPKYFNPRTAMPGFGKTSPSEAFRQAAAANAPPPQLAATPARNQLQRAANAPPLQQRPGAGGAQLGGDVQRQVASAVAQLAQGPITPERATQVAQAIASQVASQVAQQVTQQLLGGLGFGPMTAPPGTPQARMQQQQLGQQPPAQQAPAQQGQAASHGRAAPQGQATHGQPAPAQHGLGGQAAYAQAAPQGQPGARASFASAPSAQPGQASAAFGDMSAAVPNAPPRAEQARQQGRVDGWGIPRTFERDLGGADRAVVKPRAAEEGLNAAAAMSGESAVQLEAYTGKSLVKDGSNVRTLDQLFNGLLWKAMNKSEVALLKNLGWSQQSWDTKDTPAAKWPMIMATPFVSLSPLQRESVRKLGLSAADWDRRVQAFTMGKNA